MHFEKTKRRKWSWTDMRLEQAEQVNDVVNDLKKYWPLTLRQIYYRLVAAGFRGNTRSQYTDLSKLVKHMRLDNYLSWKVLEDRGRRVSRKRGWEDYQEFSEEEVEHFLEDYERCYVQDQERYVEIWCEKDALSRIFEDIAYPYCVRAVTCRGYQSVSFLADFRDRANAALSRGQTPVILYFGDLDPSGVQMFEATKQTLEDELEIRGVEYNRVALNLSQVQEQNLPHDPEAVKLSDRRYKRYVERFGFVAVELDALDPPDLEKIIKDAIESQFDMEAIREQMEIERQERERLAAIKKKVMTEWQVMTSQT
jgi:hypothetical protein